jgi:hypothetical protein
MKAYQNVELEIIILSQDVITSSGEDGEGMFEENIYGNLIS